MTDQSQNQYSIFKRGADDGAIFGCYLSVMILSLMAGYQVSWLGLVFMVLAVGVPFVCFARLRSSYVKSDGFLPVSALWMQGIVMFFCGGLIMALMAFIYLNWLNPSYFHDMNENLKAAMADPYFTAHGVDETYVDNLFAIVTPIKFVMELLLLTVFSGSILSLLMALIVPVKPLRKNDKG